MKVIRLTESDLHNMIMESVNSILNESPYKDIFGGRHHSGGRIPRDGMTGGEWYSDPFTKQYELDPQEIVDMLDNGNEGLYTREMHDALESLSESGQLYFVVSGTIEKDESVGIMSEQTNIDNVDINPAYQAILSQDDSVITLEQKKLLEDVLNDIAYKLECGRREFFLQNR